MQVLELEAAMMPKVAWSKSKDKNLNKEPPKVGSKPSSANAGARVLPSGYNPLLGTFQTADVLHDDGRFGVIDERDDSDGAGGKYEAGSNSDSWSGVEERKEKTSNLPLRQETLVGADNDKWEKIRQKNEKKHQRQKEKRAHELHEKCSGYLMSRKLETIAGQLVAMGFSSELATMALILNEGKVEESVAWLLEEGRGKANKDEGRSADTEGNLKIDISEEFARIAEMEIRFNCFKQDVERAVVACEGDLQRAEDMLRSQKQEFPSVLPKPEETSNPPAMDNVKLPIDASENLTRLKPSSSSTIPAKSDDKDVGDTKVVGPAGPSVQPESKNMLLLERAQPKLDRGKAPLVEKSYPNPSVACSLPSSLQVSLPPAKTEAHYVAVGNEVKHEHKGTVKEPVTVVQQLQSVNARPTPSSKVTSSLPGSAPPFYPRNYVRPVTPHGMVPHVPHIPGTVLHIPGTRTLSTSGVDPNHQLYNQLHYQHYQHPGQFVSSYGTLEAPGTTRGNSFWSQTGESSQTQAIAATSSCEVFSGWSTSGTYALPSLSPINWSANSGAVMHVDRRKIDWSLDYGSSQSGAGGVWSTTKPAMQHYDPRVAAKPTSKLVMPNEIGVPNPGLQNRGVSPSEMYAVGSSRQRMSAAVGSRQQTSVAGGSRQQTSVAGGSHEWTSTSTGGSSHVWTSPFEERDLFSFTRQQLVSSSSM